MLDDKIGGRGRMAAASEWTNETSVVASDKPDLLTSGSIEATIRQRAWGILQQFRVRNRHCELSIFQ
jgi:hypothetical protein